MQQWWGCGDDEGAMTDQNDGGYVARVLDSVVSDRVLEDDDFDQWLWQCQEEYEASGEVSDCMYHHARGGHHGGGRLRMFLPALNKGKWNVQLSRDDLSLACA